MSPQAEAEVVKLLLKQQAALPVALFDLTKNHKKTLHYNWFVFPTDIPGTNEPARIYDNKWVTLPYEDAVGWVICSATRDVMWCQ